MYFNKSINSDCWENDPNFKEERHLAFHTIFRFVTVSYLCSKMFECFAHKTSLTLPLFIDVTVYHFIIKN
jgi:hypothetical protein